MSGRGHVSSSNWRSITSGNEFRTTKECKKNQRYGILSALKSTLKCIKVYIEKTFSKCQGFLISRLKYLASKRVHGDMMVKALMCSLSLHSNNIKNPCLWISLLSKNKNEYALFCPFFFLTGIIKVSETINTLLRFKKKCAIIHIKT